jgi:6-phosphogluconolactonase (cycloisomerase 2 family)
MKHSEITNAAALSRSCISRRSLLAGVAALGTAVLKAGQPGSRSALTCFGTSTGAGGNGQGIYLFNLNLDSGKLTLVKLAAKTDSPGWLALHPNGKVLYTTNEISNFKGGKTGAVSAWSITRSNGDLSFLNIVSSGGAGPAHMSVDPKGQFAFVANYAGGSVAVLPINQTNGSLGNATHVVPGRGMAPVGPAKATSGPPGSFAISGHDAPHAHMIEADPAGKFVISTDLAEDRIHVWALNRSNGTLSLASSVATPPGDGPRHFVFHPAKNWMYSLQEESSTIIFFTYEPESGRLTAKKTCSSLPPGFAGTNFTSEIRISPNGRFLYAANRLHDTIAAFAIGGDGSLNRVGETPTGGDYPRSFTIDPTGNFIFCCNQRGDSVTTFKVNSQTGALQFTGAWTPLGSPGSIVFLT